MKYLISTDKLNNLIENCNDLAIIDCRFDLMDKQYGLNAYKKGHIPGSFLIDLQKDLCIEVSKHGGNHPLQDPSILNNKLKSFGIDNNTTIVAYDDGDLNGAARLFVQLELMGLKNLYILDGGLISFKKHGGQLETKFNQEKNNSNELNFKINENAIVTMEYVKSKLYDKNTIIIDSRSNVRYMGIEEPVYKKSGHIPSAKNYFFEDVLKEDFENGSLKSLDYLKEHFKELYNYKEIILSCGSGVSLCVNSIALKELNINHKIYIGSFSDWISYDSNKVMKGQE